MNYALRGALHALTTHIKCSSDKIEKTILGFGLFASVASAAAGAVTGVGPIAATVVTTACVYAMYYKLAELTGVKISKNILKSVASAVLANLVSNIGVSVLAAAALSFIPVLGNLSSSTICAIVQFASVYVSGYVFISTLNSLYEKFGNVSDLTEKEIKEAVAETNSNMNTSEIINEAKKVHKEVKNNREYSDLSEFETLVNEAKKDVE